MKTYKLKNKDSSRRPFMRVSFNLTLLFSLIILQASIAAAELAAKVDTQLEQAILAEDWEVVVRLLSDVNEPNLPAPLRLVKGHACLATNRNNESLCLFLSVTSKEDLLQWQKWSEDFTAKYPDAPITHYFAGDSSARLQQWDHAIADFNTALAIDPNLALVLNARGVAYAHQNELGKARVDLAGAIKYSNSMLADAYANIGVLRIQKKDGAETAKKAFNRALEISPAFALAFHGRACVRVVLGETAGAEEDFKNAQEYSTCSGEATLMARNRLRIAAYWKGMTETDLLATIQSGKDSGMTFDSSIQNVANAWGNFKEWAGKPGGQFAHNRFTDQFGKLSTSQQNEFFKNIMAPDLRTDPRLNSIHQQATNNLKQTNIYLTPKVATGTGIAGDIAKVGGSLAFKTHPLAGGAAIVGGEGLKGLSGNMERWGDINRNLADKLIDLQSSLPDLRTPGGFDMSLDKIVWDGGEWPFRGYYGLLFHVDTVESSSGHPETSGSDHRVAEVTE